MLPIGGRDARLDPIEPSHRSVRRYWNTPASARCVGFHHEAGAAT